MSTTRSTCGRIPVPARSARINTVRRHADWAGAATSALAVFALILLTLGFPGPASAQPGTTSPANRGEPKFLQLSVDAVNPSTITFADPALTVGATVTNIGDRAVANIAVRAQRAAAISTGSAVRTALQLPEAQFATAGQWQTLSGTLQPGQSRRVTLNVPLHGADSLRITQAGVYPLLLNVNGTPDYGSEARLDDARFLLPVLGVTSPGPRTANPATPPAATTLLWPLADRPQLVPGGDPAKPVLVSDNLASSLRGGRLDGLLTALERATEPGSDTGRALSTSVCIAVDPDLLVTVDAMRGGYRIGPAGGNRDRDRDGTGRQAASDWLARLSSLAKRLCTTTTPYAQADLAALASVNDDGLSSSALAEPAAIADIILGTTTVRGVSWPDAGAIPHTATKLLRANGINAAIVAANSVSGPGWIAPPGPTGPGIRAVTFDESVHAALAAVGEAPQTPSVTPAGARYPVSQDSRTARLQDALGALSWAASSPATARSQLIAPPQLWSVNEAEASAVLNHAATLFRLGLTTPQRLTDISAPAATAPPITLNYPQQAAVDASSGLETPIRNEAGRLGRLTAALLSTPQHSVTPASFTEPRRQDLLRALSLAGRRESDPTHRLQAQDAAKVRVDTVRSKLTELLQSVTVLAPGGAYTLASEQSPLLVAARNGLPVAVRVHVKISAPPGMTVTDIGPQDLPPNGIKNLRVPASISDSRNLIVNISLATVGPDPEKLGTATPVSVRSNAYGRALTYLTAAAGGLLVFLSGRRLMRRFRGEPDPADEGVPTRTRRRVNRYGRAKARASAQTPPPGEHVPAATADSSRGAR